LWQPEASDEADTSHGEPLRPEFYRRPTVEVARDLLGHELAHITSDGTLSGIIVETEAYLQDDAACHASRGRTRRNEVMFGFGGRAYVYFTYGCHYCLNAVTEDEGVGCAVLIRAVEPTRGIEAMRRRRGRRSILELTSGPGRLTNAFGIGLEQNGVSLSEGALTIRRSARHDTRPASVTVSTRIGISQGQRFPLRFQITGNPFVSRRR
jgi:DNA-3-methyladenine glycosylase